MKYLPYFDQYDIFYLHLFFWEVGPTNLMVIRAISVALNNNSQRQWSWQTLIYVIFTTMLEQELWVDNTLWWTLGLLGHPGGFVEMWKDCKFWAKGFGRYANFSRNILYLFITQKGLLGTEFIGFIGHIKWRLGYFQKNKDLGGIEFSKWS